MDAARPRADASPAAGDRPADAADGRPTDTRGRILDAAVALFGEHGYAGTSVRDIAERLGLTKAALYYHFPSKETILDALLDPFVTELTGIVELVRGASPPEPKAIIELMAGLLAGPGSVLSAFVNDPSVLHRKIGEEDVFSCSEEIVHALAGSNPTPTALLRARCALGAVQSGILGAAFSRRRAPSRPTGTGSPQGGATTATRAPVAQATETQTPAVQAPAMQAIATRAPEEQGLESLRADVVGWPPHSITSAEVRAVVVDAALAALGGGLPPGGRGPDCPGSAPA